jgi:hypothetical protein
VAYLRLDPRILDAACGLSAKSGGGYDDGRMGLPGLATGGWTNLSCNDGELVGGDMVGAIRLL